MVVPEEEKGQRDQFESVNDRIAEFGARYEVLATNAI
jgi:hypothetical protein